jgi:hypothetical protein
MSISRRMPAVTEAMSPAVAVSPAKAMATKPVASEPMTTEVTRAKAVAAEAMTTKAMTTEVMTAKPVAAAEVAATMMTTTTVITTTAAARGSGDWCHRRQSSDGEREQEGRSKRSAQSATNAGHSVLQGWLPDRRADRSASSPGDHTGFDDLFRTFLSTDVRSTGGNAVGGSRGAVGTAPLGDRRRRGITKGEWRRPIRADTLPR